MIDSGDIIWGYLEAVGVSYNLFLIKVGDNTLLHFSLLNKIHACIQFTNIDFSPKE